MNHAGLLVDLEAARHGGRAEIYSICNNGYSGEGFWKEILLNLEKDNVSMMYRVLERRKDVFNRYLKKYVRGEVSIKTNSLFAAWFIESLRNNDLKLEMGKNLFRLEECKSVLEMNGQFCEIYLNIISFCRIIDGIIQFSELYFHLKGKVQFLSFMCDTKLFLTDEERKRFQSIFYTCKYEEDLRDGKLEDSIYDLKTKTKDYFGNLLSSKAVRQRRCFENDINLFYDTKENLANVENGIRVTCAQPEDYVGTIYMIGCCTIVGWCVEDKNTIPSLIQKKINDLGKRYRVVNLGSIIPLDYIKLFKKIKLRPEDMIVVLYSMVTDLEKEQIPIIEIGDSMNVLREKIYPGKDIFLNIPQHCSDYGCVLYAEAIWKELRKHLNTRSKKIYKNNIYNLFQTDYRDLDVLYNFSGYFAEMKRMKEQIPLTVKTIGCIVMNCNPFTLGHRYLVETAIKKVDYVVIFVVEENRSHFTFEDRFEMVKRGAQDLENVGVIRSGKFIISDVTFSEYFANKNTKYLQENKISSIYDLRIFAKYIAPECNITYRFIGEEPLDNTTNQYNQDMKKVLPLFNINVIEIKRKKLSTGEVISATKVREGLAGGKGNQAEKMLPLTTLEYLKQKEIGF